MLDVNRAWKEKAINRGRFEVKKKRFICFSIMNSRASLHAEG